MKTNKKRYNLTLDAEIVKKVKKRLKHLDLKFSTFINSRLKIYLDEK